MERACVATVRAVTWNAVGVSASDLVHVRDHEQQALGCGEGSGQRSGLQRAVHCASGAALALDFDYLRDGTPNVGHAF